APRLLNLMPRLAVLDLASAHHLDQRLGRLADRDRSGASQVDDLPLRRRRHARFPEAGQAIIDKGKRPLLLAVAVHQQRQALHATRHTDSQDVAVLLPERLAGTIDVVRADDAPRQAVLLAGDLHVALGRVLVYAIGVDGPALVALVEGRPAAAVSGHAASEYQPSAIGVEAVVDDLGRGQEIVAVVVLADKGTQPLG